jgi:hypothetical protein
MNFPRDLLTVLLIPIVVSVVIIILGWLLAHTLR